MSTAAAYDDLVARMVAANVDPEAAHRYAAEKYPAAARERRQAADRHSNALEKDEQLEVAKLFRNFGFEVYNLSQARASKQTPGIPDLWCMHRELPIAFWWESKRQVGGRHSEAQAEFRDDCLRCGVGYGTGDRYAARTHLIKLGLAKIIGETLEPIRRVG